ncbi:MAG TPA: TRAP transporter large permease subunit, partial [Candidatus Baltobacteraceae bacterium]
AIVLASIVNRVVGPPMRLDAFASDLFLWLTMFSVAAALRRGAHLRVTAIVSRLPEGLQRQCEATAAVAVFLFAALMLLPADRNMIAHFGALAPQGVQESLRFAALYVGFALMALVAALQIAQRIDVGDLLVGVNAVCLTGAALFIGKPLLLSLGNAGLVFFALLLGMGVALGVPVAFCFGLATLAYVSSMAGLPLDDVIVHFDRALSAPVLLAVPLLIVVGYAVHVSGMLQAMTTLVKDTVGHVAGGLAYVLLISLAWVTSISGFRATDLSVFSSVLFPEIRRRGAGEREMVGILTSSTVFTQIAPPSIVMVLVAAVTGIAVSNIFATAMLPTLLCVALVAVTITVRTSEDRPEMEDRAGRARLVRAWVLGSSAFVPLLFSWYAVPSGILTPSEAAVLVIVYVLAIGATMYGKLDMRALYAATADAGATAGSLLLVVASTGVAVWALAQAGFVQQLAAVLVQIPGDHWTFMAVSLLVFALLGATLAGLPALIFLAPLLTPIAEQLGIGGTHYVLVAACATGIGGTLPPFTGGYAWACRIAQVPSSSAGRVVRAYLGMLIFALLLLAFLPLTFAVVHTATMGVRNG